MLGIALPLWAFDFESPREEGYTLYFNILADDEDNVVEVTSPMATGKNRWQGHKMPWGELVIPATVEHEGVTYTVVAIGDKAFWGCDEITSITLPTTVTEIGDYAFYQCKGIEGTVTIGEEMLRIGRSAFYGCSGITEVNFNAEKCVAMGVTKTTVAFGGCRSLTRVNFGPNVTRIPDYAFYGMDKLRFEWALPEALEEVGEQAFASCSNIEGILRLPQGVKSIGTGAFSQCLATTGIELPVKLEQVNSRAFYKCTGVREVNVKTLVPPVLGSEVFAGLKSNVQYNVPCISIDQYKESPSWKKIGNMRTTYPCKMDIIACLSDSAAGMVTGSGSYTAGETAVLTVICNAGFGFMGWKDGNMDNPRTVVVNDTATYLALMQPAEVIHEVKYIHDTTYMDGIETVVEYYEINDVAIPIDSQREVVYNKNKRRIEVPMEKSEIVGIALYNDAGQCVFTGMPNNGRISIRRFPTGAYIVRVTTLYDETVVRFFHVRKKTLFDRD